MYCTQCYRVDGKGTEEAPYIFNGKSLCNLHFWEEVKADEALPAPATTPKRGTRLPEGWVPDEHTVGRMMTELAVPKAFLIAEHRKFCDYFYSAPGVKGVKIDWGRTWCNWMRTAAERGQLRGDSTQRRTNDDKIRELMEMGVAEGQ